MRKHRNRAGAAALAVVIGLFAASPAFAARDDRDPRGARERVIRLITKIKGILTIGANDDGLSVPRP